MADRQFPRYALSAAVTVRHDAIAATGKTQNVSRGGACATVEQPMPVGAGVTVELSLIFDDNNTSEWLALPARVVWSTELDEQHQIGLSFLALTADQARYLELFLRYLADQPGRHNVISDHADLFTEATRGRKRR